MGTIAPLVSTEAADDSVTTISCVVAVVDAAAADSSGLTLEFFPILMLKFKLF